MTGESGTKTNSATHKTNMDNVTRERTTPEAQLVGKQQLCQKNLWLLLALLACTGVVFFFSNDIANTLTTNSEVPTVPPRHHKNVTINRDQNAVKAHTTTAHDGQDNKQHATVSAPRQRRRDAKAATEAHNDKLHANETTKVSSTTTEHVVSTQHQKISAAVPHVKNPHTAAALTPGLAPFKVKFKDCVINHVLKKPLKIQWLTKYKPEEFIADQATHRWSKKSHVPFGYEHKLTFYKDEFTYAKCCRAYFDALLFALKFRLQIEYAPVAASQYFFKSTSALMKFSQYERNYLPSNEYSLIDTKTHRGTMYFSFRYYQFAETSSLYKEYKPYYSILQAQSFKPNVFPIRFPTEEGRSIYFYNSNFFVVGAERDNNTDIPVRFLVIFNPNIDIQIPENLTHLLRRTLSDDLKVAKQYNDYLNELASICGTVIDFFERLCGIRLFLENHSYCQQSQPIFHIQIKFPLSTTRMTQLQFNEHVERLEH